MEYGIQNSGWCIGQKVVCINGSFSGAVWEWCSVVPVAGEIYTIRAMTVTRNYLTGMRCLAFLLEELDNYVPPHCERAFCYNRFRALAGEETMVAAIAALEAEHCPKTAGTYAVDSIGSPSSSGINFPDSGVPA